MFFKIKTSKKESSFPFIERIKYFVFRFKEEKQHQIRFTETQILSSSILIAGLKSDKFDIIFNMLESYTKLLFPSKEKEQETISIDDLAEFLNRG